MFSIEICILTNVCTDDGIVVERHEAELRRDGQIVVEVRAAVERVVAVREKEADDAVHLRGVHVRRSVAAVLRARGGARRDRNGASSERCRPGLQQRHDLDVGHEVFAGENRERQRCRNEARRRIRSEDAVE